VIENIAAGINKAAGDLEAVSEAGK